MELDAARILDEMVPANQPQQNTSNNCAEVLKRLGYEVHEEPAVKGINLVVKNKEARYSLLTLDEASIKDDRFGIPVGGEGIHLYSSPADRIAIIHDGQVYEFDLNGMKSFLQPVVDKLMKNPVYAFTDRQTAVEMKRLHARYEANGTYSILFYVPISTLTTRLAHTKQKI